jgi:Tfp pilus assembly protein PilO
VNRRIALMAGGAAVLLLGVWFMLLWSPKGSELNEARERNATAEQQVNELQVKLDRLKDLEKREPELLATRDRLDSAVPEESQLAEFILDANDAATEAGVDFISIAPTKPVASKIPGAPPTIHITLAVEGDYFATLNFLDLLAELPRVVVLDQIKLSPSGDSSRMAADLSGSIFTTETPVVPGAQAATGASASTTTTTVKP